MNNQIEVLKKLVLMYQELVEKFPNDPELIEDCENEMMVCFETIESIEKLAAEQTVTH